MPLSIRGSALKKPSADDQPALDDQPEREAQSAPNLRRISRSLKPVRLWQPPIRLPSRRCGFDRQRSIGLPEHFRHLSSCTVDSDQDVIDLTFGDIIDLPVDTGLVDRSQLGLTSTRLSGVDTQARSF
ncbi:hypothetical protein FMUND_331 [Fusarium mundagurra]|uniref:Uncharacterized protein n=1 Tax=Fusarium mundagurra TaxID=1567541 RepID=A0A8H5Z6T0_9HYPO|nr:hypothetical protein FMUND_331 [Fusarium mundagurra]